MPEPKLLSDDELKAIIEDFRVIDETTFTINHPDLHAAWQKLALHCPVLLSHIAAQAALLKERIEIHVDGEELPVVVSRLEQLPTYAGVAIREYALRLKEQAAEIERLKTKYRNAIESARRSAWNVAEWDFANRDDQDLVKIARETADEWTEELKILEATRG